jgi:hypothetical protein
VTATSNKTAAAVVTTAMITALRRGWPMLVLALALSSVASAKPYVDTKSRFRIDPAPGWELAPLTGDTTGMAFRRKHDGIPASLHVQVRPMAAGETAAQALDRKEREFRTEIGFNPGSDTPSTVAGLPALTRTLSVFASGDRKTVRDVTLTALLVFGHVHLFHFETLERKRTFFARDLDRMIGSYVPMAGKELTAPLVSTWISTGGGPDLLLEPDGAFRMGPLSGGWQADGGLLTLRVKQGQEAYRYVINVDTLTLTSANLDGDLVFRRSGAARYVEPVVAKKRSGAVTREELIGTWKVVQEGAPADEEPLVLHLSASGSVAFGPLSGRWRFSTGRLTIVSTAGVTITYAAGLDGSDHLQLSGGDLEHELSLVRD